MIGGEVGDASSTACVFCRIVAGAEPASFVHRDELVSAFLDIRSVTRVICSSYPTRTSSALAICPTISPTTSSPVGSSVRLDEAEFEASDLAARDPDAARRALAALDALEQLAADGFREVTGG